MTGKAKDLLPLFLPKHPPALQFCSGHHAEMSDFSSHIQELLVELPTFGNLRSISQP